MWLLHDLYACFYSAFTLGNLHDVPPVNTRLLFDLVYSLLVTHYPGENLAGAHSGTGLQQIQRDNKGKNH